MMIRKMMITSLAAIALLGSSAISFADEMVGRITGVNLQTSTVSIDGDTYRVTSAALAGTGPNQKTRLRLNELDAGQIIAFKTTNDAIIRLELLHGYTDIPN